MFFWDEDWDWKSPDMFGFGGDIEDYPYSTRCEECKQDDVLVNHLWKRQLCINCRVTELTPPGWEWKFLLELSEWDEKRQRLR